LKKNKEQRFVEKHEWEKVKAPQVWRPHAGAELNGYYGGRTLKNGTFGQYQVVLVHTLSDGAWTASGTGLITLIDAAMIQIGHPIRIQYQGSILTGQDADGKPKTFKKYEVYKAIGPSVPSDLMPRIHGYS
jgi:hypothetical protein